MQDAYDAAQIADRWYSWAIKSRRIRVGDAVWCIRNVKP